jgi:LacI family transcriptional regulator
LEEKPPAWLKTWKPDGVIARIETQGLARSLAALRVPTVDLRGKFQLPGVITLDTDSAATAKLAAEHFIDRGFRNFAFCGYPGLNFSDQRCQGFVQYLAERGYRAAVYAPPEEKPSGETIRRETEGALHEEEIAKWLLTLPRPLAVMTCNDARGRQVIDACAQHQIRVPEEVAVIGVDNDEVLCGLSNPPLSSVKPDAERIGYLGAELLHQKLQGKPIEEPTQLIPPTGIVTRLSSDILAVDDPVVAEAMHLIRQHACTGISVENLLDFLSVSRATLERRFIKLLGRSPKDELQRLRLQKAEDLLRETSYLLTTIAEMTGFKTVAHMSVVFKAHAGISPGQYRIRARGEEVNKDSTNDEKPKVFEERWNSSAPLRLVSSHTIGGSHASRRTTQGGGIHNG